MKWLRERRERKPELNFKINLLYYIFMAVKNKIERKESRRKRIRAKISGTSNMPRIYIFRSNKHIYLSAVDDEKGKTIFSFSDLKLKEKAGKKNKTEIAKMVGEEFGKNLKDKKIKKTVFDRGGYKYHGRVKSAAEGARSAGLEF